MLVTEMAVHLLLGGPPEDVVLAIRLRTLPGPRMRLLVLVQVTGSHEGLAAARFKAAVQGRPIAIVPERHREPQRRCCRPFVER